MKSLVKTLDATIPIDLVGFFEQSKIPPESLAIFRIGMGSLLIGGCILIWTNFTLLFSESGWVPYSAAKQIYSPTTASLPIWELSSSNEAFVIVLLIALVSGVAITIGWKTRIATIIAFFALTAIHARNPAATHIGGVFYHKLLFFMIFLPTNAVWSLDAYNSDIPTPDHYTGLATVGILGQITLMYLINGGRKIFNPAMDPANALPLIIEYDLETYTTATLLNHLPVELLSAMSSLWAWMLFLSPILLLTTNGHLRSALTVPYIIAHGIMAATIRVGGFPYVLIFALVLFIQPKTWTLLKNTILQQPIKTVSSLKSTIQPIRDTINLERAINHIQSLRTNNSSSTQNSTTNLNWLPKRQSYITGIIFLLFLTGNILVITNPSQQADRNPIETATMSLGLVQPQWSFFAHEDVFKDEWYSHIITTNDGEQYDIFNDRPPSTERPYEGNKLHYQFKSHRIAFYEYGMHNAPKYSPLKKPRAEYICNNIKHNGSSIKSVTFYRSVSPYNMSNRFDDDKRKVHTEKVYQHNCSN